MRVMKVVGRFDVEGRAEYRGGGFSRPKLQDAVIIPLTSDSKMVTLSTVQAMSCMLVSKNVEKGHDYSCSRSRIIW